MNAKQLSNIYNYLNYLVWFLLHIQIYSHFVLWESSVHYACTRINRKFSIIIIIPTVSRNYSFLTILQENYSPVTCSYYQKLWSNNHKILIWNEVICKMGAEFLTRFMTTLLRTQMAYFSARIGVKEGQGVSVSRKIRATDFWDVVGIIYLDHPQRRKTIYALMCISCHQTTSGGYKTK